MCKTLVLHTPLETLLRRPKRLLALHLLATMTFSLSSLSVRAQVSPNPGATYVYDAEGRVLQAVISDGTRTVTIKYATTPLET